MAKSEEKNHAVVTPLLGAGVLGTGAYGSHKLNNYLDSIGLRKGLKLNPEAIKAIEDFGKYTIEGSGGPSKAVYRYADLANKASKSQLFLNDKRKTWEWFLNNEKMTGSLADAASRGQESIGRASKSVNKFNRNILSKIIGRKGSNALNRFLNKKLFDPAQTNLGEVEGFLTPFQRYVRDAKLPSDKSLIARLAAHEAEIGSGGKARALLRLMQEGAGEPAVSPEGLAKRTTEALRRWDKTVYNFKSPLEYFNWLSGRKKGDKLYEAYLKHFDSLTGQKLTKKDMLSRVRQLLVPGSEGALPSGKAGKIHYIKSVTRDLGSTTKWTLDEATGKFVPAKKFKLAPGVKRFGDIKKTIEKSPLLSFLAAGQAEHYAKPYGQAAKVLKWTQRLRNPRLAATLGLGAAGLGSLGLINIGRNMSKKEDSSIFDKIKNKFS